MTAENAVDTAALDTATLETLRESLAGRAGAYLCNAIREPLVTCAVCAAPCAGHELCPTCLRQRRESGSRADQVAMLVYGVAGAQSGYLMRGYKAVPQPIEEHRVVVAMIVMLGLGLHSRCAAIALGRPLTHWAVLPSLPAKPGPHPLRELVAPAAYGTEILMSATAAQDLAADPRAISQDHFLAETVPADSHVLLIDDTWTTGGHAQSGVLALRAGGAGAVSLLVVARWLLPGYAQNRSFYRTRATRPYEPRKCPWTTGSCPDPVPAGEPVAAGVRTFR